MLKLIEENFIANLNTLKAVNPTTSLGLVLKANAYNHDIIKVAKLSQKIVDWYLVSNINEAVAIANLEINKPILILYTFSDDELTSFFESYPNAQSLIAALSLVRFSIYSKESLERLIKFVQKCSEFFQNQFSNQFSNQDGDQSSDHSVSHNVNYSSNYSPNLSSNHSPNKIPSSNHIKLCITCHLNIDTGMHCLGVEDKIELEQIIELLRNNQEYIQLEGVWTHLATADELNSDYYNQQLLCFKDYLREYFINNSKNNFIKLRIIHFQNTASYLRQDHSNFELEQFGIPIMARIGLGAYGHYPSSEIKQLSITKNISLLPALELRSILTHIKYLKKGDSISYGCSYVCDKKTSIGIVPMGYADGYSRMLSNLGTVRIQNQTCRILGRIRMNMFVVDISNIQNVKIGDPVILLGGSDNSQSIDLAAKIENTINYEILTKLKP